MPGTTGLFAFPVCHEFAMLPAALDNTKLVSVTVRSCLQLYVTNPAWNPNCFRKRHVMDRRSFIHQILPATAALGVCGCVRLLSHDPPPERGLLESRWTGYDFHTVRASYTLPLVKPHKALWRSRSQLGGTLGDSALVPLEAPSIRPTHARVNLDYVQKLGKERQNEMQVELRWPRPAAHSVNGESTFKETKTATVSFASIRDLLESSGQYRVDRYYHYYGRASSRKKKSKSDMAKYLAEVPVMLTIAGPNPDGRVSKTLYYPDVWPLQKLAARAWPLLGNA